MLSARTTDGYRLLHEGSLALTKVEQNGIRIDLDYCVRTSADIQEQMRRLESEYQKTDLYKLMTKIAKGKITMKREDVLREALFDKMGLFVEGETKKGKKPVDAENLRKLTKHVPELSLLLEWRKLARTKTTYLDQFIREEIDSLLHPTYNLDLIPTYRSSTRNPSFQNNPKRDPIMMQYVREAFIPRPGNVLSEWDISGAEVNVAACYHKDPTMIEYIMDDSKDMHRDMAMQCYKLPQKEMTKDIRHSGKNEYVFPEFYGSWHRPIAGAMWQSARILKTKSGESIRKHLKEKGIRSHDQFEKHIADVEDDFWGNRFPVYQEWRDRVWDYYQEHGYVDLFTGFRCQDITDRNKVINRPIQGSAFHILLQALIWFQKAVEKRKMETMIIGQIHDAMVMDGPPQEIPEVNAILNRIMDKKIRNHWPWIIVPVALEAEISEINGNWADMREMDSNATH